MSFVDKVRKYDNVWVGIIVAFVLLVIGFVLSYFVKGYPTVSFSKYLRYLTNGNSDRMDILIFSILPNMILFYFTNFRWQLYEFVKGLVVVSVIFCLIIVLLSL
ncbi:MAG: hypothetical protein AB8B74_07920 [Crocinitomicaceae bacterium]